MKDNSYEAVMARKAEIIRNAVGVDYSTFESGSIAFDYEALMASTGYTIDDVIEIQRGFAIGNTPLLELKNITALVRKLSKPGFGARIFVKDEAANPSGSFKVRRAATSIHHARKTGFTGALTATSGNYGAAVASCCAKSGLKCIIVQECYDSRGTGQPEIIEKSAQVRSARRGGCAAHGRPRTLLYRPAHAGRHGLLQCFALYRVRRRGHRNAGVRNRAPVPRADWQGSGRRRLHQRGRR